MIKINLMPQAKMISFWQVRYLYAFVAMFIIFLSAVWGFLIYTEYNLESDLQEARQQHELFKPTLTQAHHADAKLQLITTRQTLLLTLTKERLPLYAGITRIGAIIPDGVWLTELKSDRNGLRVSGMAKTFPELTSFLKKIQEDTLFTNFSLNRTEYNKGNTQFEFTVQFKEL